MSLEVILLSLALSPDASASAGDVALKPRVEKGLSGKTAGKGSTRTPNTSRSAPTRSAPKASPKPAPKPSPSSSSSSSSRSSSSGQAPTTSGQTSRTPSRSAPTPTGSSRPPASSPTASPRSPSAGAPAGSTRSGSLPDVRADRLSGSTTQISGQRGAPTHPTRMGGDVVSGRSVQSPAPLGSRPTGALRPFDASQPGNASRPGTAGTRPAGVPPHRSSDVRYSRPAASVVRPHPHAHYRPPVVHTYRGWYTRWYCHPYYRFHYSTVAVVGFGFGVYAWHDYWVPPARHGWAWVPGYWSWGYWHPGFWRPVAMAPVGYVYVAGWWESDAYVEGYYRSNNRNGWSWNDGYYLDEGTYIRGNWTPNGAAPEGYTWEPGFWDGNESIDGFWRPDQRRGYRWVSGYYDDDGVFEAGYWLPIDEVQGSIWIPGWFDGNTWVEGYWVDEQEYYSTDLDAWQPEEGYDDGWEMGTGWGDGEVVDDRSGEPPTAQLIKRLTDETGEAPLAVPVAIPAE